MSVSSFFFPTLHFIPVQNETSLLQRPRLFALEFRERERVAAAAALQSPAAAAAHQSPAAAVPYYYY